MDRDSRLDLLEQKVELLTEQAKLHTEQMELVIELAKGSAAQIDSQQRQLEATTKALADLAELMSGD